MTPRGGSEQVTLCGAAAVLLSALALDPLVDGHRWLLGTVVTIAAVVATGAALRQVLPARAVIVLVQAGVLLVMLSVLFARDRAVLGVLPGPDAMRHLLDVLASGLDLTQSQAPPVDARPGVLLMLTGGVGVVALLVDVLAATLRQPALAGLPLLAIYCVPASLPAGGVAWYQFVLTGAGFLMLISADAGDRVRSWGRVLAVRARGGGSGTGELGGVAREGRRVAIGTLVLAALVPAIVPGLEGGLLPGTGEGGDGDGDGPTISVINPILDMRSRLNSRSDTVVLSYRTSEQNPQPLRIVTADTFDGDKWAPDTGSIPLNQRVDRGMPPPPGLSSAVRAVQQQTDVFVRGLRQTYLPLPYPTTRVDVTGDWLYDVSTLNVVGRGVNTRGLEYSVQHLQVTPTDRQLAEAQPPPQSLSLAYTQYPQSMPAIISDRARQVAGTGDAYQQAVRLQRWFRTEGGFRYSTEAPGNGRDDSGMDAMVRFLDEKQGYCVHYASAMALMARALNIPARVAVGFLPGTRQADNSWNISLQDAHAWPELYFQGVGWVRFEPTPASRTGGLPTWAAPAPGLLPEDGPDATPEPSASGSAEPAPRQPDQNVPTEAGGAATEEGLLQSIPWRLVGVLAGLLVLGCLPMLAAAGTRRRRWRKAAGQAGRAEAAWDELRQRLSDLGVRWAASWTPRALQARLADDYRLEGAERAALTRLVTDLETARYARPNGAGPNGGGRTAAELARDVRAIAGGVALAVSGRTRRRARLLPQSGIAAITGFGRRVDVAADDAGRRLASAGESVRRLVGAGRR